MLELYFEYRHTPHRDIVLVEGSHMSSYLLGSYGAECSQFIISREFVLWVLADVQFLALLGGLNDIAFDEHFNLQCQIILIRVGPLTTSVTPFEDL